MSAVIVYLIGMPGCGKSKTAKYLQIEKNVKVVDLDKLIEEESGTEIATIFSKYGEEYFRVLETRTLEKIGKSEENIVVSCGGGIVTRKENKLAMRNGITIFLDASVETLKEHLSNSSTVRPLLKVKTIEEIYNERINLYYEFADYIIKYENYMEAANNIMKIMNNQPKKKILVVNGPNLNMLGLRDPKHYGSLTLEEINNLLSNDKSVELEFYQSNHEGCIVDKLQEYKKYDGIIINPAAYTHTSVAIHDILEIIDILKVEVHLSAVDNREDYRKVNFVRDVVDMTFQGEKEGSYLKALQYLKNKLNVL